MRLSGLKHMADSQNPVSSKLYHRALQVTPGGVHSPVRAFGHVGGEPLFIASANGSQLTDADGHHYTDYCLAFGPLILGHADNDVALAVQQAVERGWSYGAAESSSLQLAELISERIPWAQQLRFVNSGTEAVMSALRLARAATGRDLVVKFTGCYHGHVDSMLIDAGSGMAGIPASAGISSATATDTLVLPLNDLTALQKLFSERGKEIAAAIIEPLPANHGLLPQSAGFLMQLAVHCKQHGALLIFDEVISGFRTRFGGMAEELGIEPDIVTWGKIIGGGFPVGAFAANRKLMKRIAPLGDVYQAGTLSANPVAMQAGLATLMKLLDGKVYQQLERRGLQLEQGLAGHPQISIVRRGSVFWLYLGNDSADAQRDAPVQAHDIARQHLDRYPGLFRHLLEHGIYMPPSPYEVGFLCTAHSEADIENLLVALQKYRPE